MPAKSAGMMMDGKRRVRRRSDASPDLRRRRHRRLDRLFPELPRRSFHRGRAHRAGLRRVGQVGRFPGARLVRRNPARIPGKAKLCAACQAARSDRRRPLPTYAGFAGAQESDRRPHRAYDLAWLSGRVSLGQRLGSAQTTAQVHPGRFTEAMMRAAQARGAELRLGCVRGLVRAGSGAGVKGIEVDGEIVEGDVVVIAMGPWSILAAGWLPLPAVFGLKGHSLVFETGTEVTAEALFLEYREASGVAHSPEVFPRPDGTTYVCAISSESPLPKNPAEVAPDPGAIELLEAMCARVSP